jgi:hypothetical protein
MDELLLALRLGDAVEIKRLASELLVNKDNQLNVAEANAFSKYAPCKITPQRRDIYHARSYVGTIEYGTAIYTFS